MEDTIKSMTNNNVIGSINGRCFITTATLKNVKIEHESSSILNIFRWFRDNWLINESDGKMLIEEYYRIAPEIVKKIDEQEDREKIYTFLWEKYLKRCFELISCAEFRAAKDTYVDMMRMLVNKYHIDTKIQN